MTKIKICGLKRMEDVYYVNEFNPDYVGFVFGKSSRFVTDDLALKLKKNLNSNIQTVGVFVNEKKEHIVKLVNDHVIDLIQLHGDENNYYINELKKQIDVPIIKAIRLKDEDTIKNQLKIKCDYYLFDSYVSQEIYGGSGKKINEELVPNVKKDFFIAGGIDINNVESLIKKYNPYCIDVSSSVETNGFKDKEKINKIISKVRKIG